MLTSYDDDDSGSSAIREVQLIPTESGFLTRSYQKCSGDFSAKALICLKPHPEFAQVGLNRLVEGREFTFASGGEIGSRSAVLGEAELVARLASPCPT